MCKRLIYLISSMTNDPTLLVKEPSRQCRSRGKNRVVSFSHEVFYRCMLKKAYLYNIFIYDNDPVFPVKEPCVSTSSRGKNRVISHQVLSYAFFHILDNLKTDNSIEPPQRRLYPDSSTHSN